MSRTHRQDYYVQTDHKHGFVLFGEFVDCSMSPLEKAKAQRDKKKGYKPGRNAKVSLSKGEKAARNRGLHKVIQDPDNAPMPRQPKTHVWDYN